MQKKKIKIKQRKTVLHHPLDFSICCFHQALCRDCYGAWPSFLYVSSFTGCSWQMVYSGEKADRPGKQILKLPKRPSRLKRTLMHWSTRPCVPIISGWQYAISTCVHYINWQPGNYWN